MINAPARIHLEKAFKFVRFYTGEGGVELLLLRYAYGYTYNDLADHFGVPVHRIKKIHDIALEALKVKLRRTEMRDFVA
jgi:hypothetical protein